MEVIKPAFERLRFSGTLGDDNKSFVVRGELAGFANLNVLENVNF
jgi:hypothetical protein